MLPKYLTQLQKESGIMPAKDIRKYTSKSLQQKCRQKSLKNYRAMNKKQLYAYCVENRSLDEVMKTPNKKAIDKTLEKMEERREMEEEMCAIV